MAWKAKTSAVDIPTRVFISATSKDLGTVREMVKQALLTMGCMPIEQSNFPPDYRSVREMLRQKIANCEAVIHIVGLRYGAEPDPATLPEGTARRSYTQIEAEIARQLDKKLYLFVCPENFPYDSAPPEAEEKRQLQQTYRQELSKGEALRTEIKDREQVALKVRELQFELEKLQKRLHRDWRRQMFLAASLILILALIAGGIFYIAREVTGTRHQITNIERSRHADLEAVGAELISLQTQLAQAGQKLSDLKPEAIYQQLSKRLGLSKEEIASLIAIGKHSKDLSEQAAAALASLDFGQAESLYVQAATTQEQNFLKAAHDLLGAGRAASLSMRFAEVVGHLERADGALTAAGGREKDPKLWFEIRDTWITALFQDGIRAEPQRGVAALRKSLEMAKETLTQISRSLAPQDWAQTQNDLGNVLENLGMRTVGDESAQYFKQSVAAFRSALEVRTREQSPQDWAMTQNNLGVVLKDLGTRTSGDESAQYFKQSVAAYRSALEVYTREQSPQDWAMTQDNLGNVLKELGTRTSGDESAQYFKQSVAAHRNALEVRTHEQLPQDWARTQNNLGNVLDLLGTRTSGEESAQYFKQSVDAYLSALEVYTREQLPQDWAATQNNLGIVLDELGTRTSGEESAQYFKQSVAAYRSALEVYTRQQLPQDWARTQNNLGNVLKEHGTRTSGEESAQYFKQSVAAYRGALEVRTREQLPQDWAMTQNNLGNVLKEHGTRTSGEESAQYFKQSVAAYRSALEVRTREQLPQDWATTQNNLGLVLRDLGTRTAGDEGKRLLGEAITAFSSALEIFTPETNSYAHERAKNSLRKTREALVEKADKP